MCHPELPGGISVSLDSQSPVSIPVGDGETLPAVLAYPAGDARGTVLIVTDIFGVSPVYREVSGRLAEAGYLALCPDIFFRDGEVEWGDIEAASARRARMDQNRTIGDLREAVAWLRRRPERPSPTVGTIGFCMGGTFTLDLAAYERGLATVCFYGFPEPEPDRTALSPPVPLELADRICGPLLGFWGEEDHRVGVDGVRRLEHALASNGQDADFTIYPGAGHGFFVLGWNDPNHPSHAQAADAWRRTLDFFGSHLS
jgi:carboxymethylenebutenolidase